MSVSGLVRFWLTALIVVVPVALQGTSAHAQQRGGTAQTDKVQPVNSGPNPYRVIRDWAQIEEGRGAAPTASPSTATASPCGQPTDARQEPLRVVSEQKQIQSTNSTSQGRRSGASAAECLCGRMASMLIETEMCG